MAEIIEICASCPTVYFGVISKFYEKDSKTTDFLRAHGVLPSTVDCPHCDIPCVFREDEHVWRCTRSRPAPKSRKRKRCDYSVSDYKGTFLHTSQVQPWKLLLFVNEWLSKQWDYATVSKCMQFTKETSINLELLCGKVVEKWFDNLKPIGGPSIEVEIDETFILKKADKENKFSSEFWVFGGIERVSKSKFIVPLPEPVGEKHDQQTKLAIIKKYILPGSVIYSDAQNAYLTLKDHGYMDHFINRSQEIVNRENPPIHIQNILSLWRDLKDRVKRPTIQPGFSKLYLARYFFSQSFEDEHLHHFFVEAAKLYPPLSDQVQVSQAISSAEEDNQSDGLSLSPNSLE